MAQQWYRRSGGSPSILESMPDGSAIVFGTSSEVMHSLNQTARLVWETCEEPVTVADVAHVLERRTRGIEDATSAAQHALDQLVALGLLEVGTTAPEAPASPSRRSALLVAVGAPIVAFVTPLVISMTIGAQNSHAQVPASPLPTVTPTPT